MPFELRITDAGRAALADGQNRGTNAIRLTKMAIGSGSGPGGVDDDAIAALRMARDTVALTGTSTVSGRIAVRGVFNPAEAYDVTEAGIIGRVGAGAEELYAYWTDGGTKLAATVAATRLVIAGSLDIAPAAAEVMVMISASISLGDPALSASVTSLGGRIDALETADFAAQIGAALMARMLLAGRVDVLEQSDTALDVRLDALEDEDFGALIMALTGRVTTLEGGSVINSIQKGYAVLNFQPTDLEGETLIIPLATPVNVSRSMLIVYAARPTYITGDNPMPTAEISGANAVTVTLRGPTQPGALPGSRWLGFRATWQVVEFS